MPNADSDPDSESDPDLDPDSELQPPTPLQPPRQPLGPRLLDAAERRFGKLAIPHLVRYLAIFQALTYLLAAAMPDYVQKLVFDREAILSGEVWRIFTCLVLPPGNMVQGLGTANFIIVILIMFFYFMISNGLESAWGSFRVNVYVLSSLLLMTIVILVFDAPFFLSGYTRPSFIVFQILVMAFAYHFPDVQILFMMFLPLKIKWLGWLAAFTMVVSLGRALLTKPIVDNQWTVALVILAGVTPFLLAFGRTFIQQQQLRAGNAQRRERFDSRLPDPEEAFHRCSVCDATEQSHPELEFRVASDGEEYCLEHLPSTSPSS